MHVTLTGVLPLPLTAEPDFGVEYMVGDVPFPDAADPAKVPNGLLPPPTALTLLYGQRDTMRGLQQVRALLAERGLRAIPVTVLLRHHIGARTRYDRASLADTSILHLDRLAPDLREHVIARYRQYAREAGQPYPTAESDTVGHRLAIVRHRPQYVARLLQEREFRRVGVVVYPVATAGRATMRASLFDGRLVESVSSPYYPGLRVVVPTWLRAPRPPARSGGAVFPRVGQRPEK